MEGQAYQEAERKLWELLTELKKYQRLCIYGAGNRAKEIIQMRKLGFLDMEEPECFLVTEMQGNRESIDNPPEIDGIPVYTLHGYTAKRLPVRPAGQAMGDTAVLVVMMEHYHHEIQERLLESPFSDVFFLTDRMERVLMARCIEYYYGKLGFPFVMTDMEPEDCHAWDRKNQERLLLTYMVRCVQDVGLEDEVPSRSWVATLQAGAALTKKRIAEATDADGENISDKNEYYNEMTGLYWLWKNTDIPFSGICHYRRQFESDMALKPLLEGTADVVLPMPAIVYPDLQGYYKNWGEQVYYEMMLQVIGELEPDYYESAVWCARHEIFYPNNIFIAKREILEDYCRFAFKILDEVEARMEEREGRKQKRCWLSEHVTTIYYIKHCRDYKIVFSNLKRYW